MKIGIDMDAVSMLSSLDYLQQNFAAIVQATLDDGARDLKRQAALITPIDTGELVTSAVVRRTGKSSSNVSASLSYEAPHAFWVHERNLRYRHGSWHYLSDPTKDYQAQAAQRLRRYYIPRLSFAFSRSRGGRR